MKRRAIYWIFPVLGTVFCLWYVAAATCDVVYSDYVRLVNSYLPDVWNPAKFFTPDVLTRIPVNYLSRIVNVGLFGFSTTFDMAFGALGLGFAGLALGWYGKSKSLGPVWFLVLTAVMFSLNKWEMLTNGSGWTHFLAFGCFYYHYLVLDRVYAGEEKPSDSVKLLWLPFVITLGVAGPYCAVYSAVLVLAYGFIMIAERKRTKRWDRRWLAYMGAVLIPFLLYLWSNSYAVEDHAGAVSAPLMQTLLDTPSFFLRFFIKSFSSMVLGGETEAALFQTNAPYFILGAAVLAAYLLALWLNFKSRLYRETVFPLILVVSGLMNHVLILVSRWIFLKEDYGISSRYALQFQVGILGILLTFALLWDRLGEQRRKAWIRIASAGFGIVFLAGNCFTTYQEIQKARYREENFAAKREIALDFENQSDEALKNTFEYRQSEADSGEKVRAALTILRDNGWNVFREGTQQIKDTIEIGGANS